MSADSQVIKVSILGKDYRVGCETGHESELNSAARLLDSRMRDIRNSGKVIGTDRIAVMAALNLAHELLSKDNSDSETVSSANKRLRALRERIEIALNDSTQLEL